MKNDMDIEIRKRSKKNPTVMVKEHGVGFKKKPKPVVKPVVVVKPATTKSVANKLMSLDGNAWDSLKIESGSQLYSDQELQKKYIQKLGAADAIMDTAPSTDAVMDILEDNNYHSLYNYFVLRGVSGEARMDMYNKGFILSESSFLNPANVTPRKWEKGGVMRVSRNVSMNEKAEQMVGSTTWNTLDSMEKADVVSELVADGALAVFG